MKAKLSKDLLQLKGMIEYLREELNSLVVGPEKLYRNEKILALSAALDEVIVEYMDLVGSRKYSTK